MQSDDRQTSPTTSPDPAALRAALLEWFATNGRRIPAREVRDPWRILVLEVMSQQTQIERAASGAEAFCARFPSPAALAQAAPADAVRAWSGLGYNRRAVALWQAARLIQERHDGEVPAGVDELDALPGVGLYTARAVAVHAFGLPVAPVDVNMRRLIGRLRGTRVAAEIQPAADALVGGDDPSTAVHALMDLAASVCRPRSPDCAHCPLAFGCASALRVETAARTPASDRVPFPATKRWLRGALVRELTTLPAGEWRDYAGRSVGLHEPHAVREALAGLAADGLIDLEAPASARLRERG